MYTENSKEAQQLLTEARLARFRQVASQRLSCLTAVYENTYDPHNVQACIRTAECLGLARVFVVGELGPEANEKVTKYANRWLDVIHCRTPVEVAGCLKSDGYTLAGTVLQGDPTPFDEISLPEKLAVVLGNEKDGLSPAMVRLCDVKITIPMFGFTQSLNLSVASALLVHHFARAYRRRGGAVHLPDEECQALIDSWCDRDVRKKAHNRLPAAEETGEIE